MKIRAFRSRIHLLDPGSQTITIGQICAKWRSIINLCPIVGDTFRTLRCDENNNLIINRQDVFDTEAIDQRIIKALIWGYPRGMQGTRNLQSIVAHLPQIVQLINDYNQGPLTQERFIAAYRSLSSISGLKQSTLSKVLYFCNVSIGYNRATIVDANVIEAFSYFEDYHDASFEKDSAGRYLRQIEKMNSSARRNGLAPDQVELFLFEIGKEGKRIKRNFLANY